MIRWKMQQFRIPSFFRVPLLCTLTKDDRVLLSQLYRVFKLSMDVAGASDTVAIFEDGKSQSGSPIG